MNTQSKTKGFARGTASEFKRELNARIKDVQQARTHFLHMRLPGGSIDRQMIQRVLATMPGYTVSDHVAGGPVCFLRFPVQRTVDEALAELPTSSDVRLLEAAAAARTDDHTVGETEWVELIGGPTFIVNRKKFAERSGFALNCSVYRELAIFILPPRGDLQTHWLIVGVEP